MHSNTLPAFITALSPAALQALALGAEAEITGDVAGGQTLRHSACTPTLDNTPSTLVAHRWASHTNAHPVVLLHGGSGSWSHWWHTIAALRASHRTVWALDLPGMGASDLPAGVRDADDVGRILASALPAWLTSVGDGGAGVDLVGFSFGALSAAYLAALWPAHNAPRIARLILVGAPGLGLLDKPAYTLHGWQHLQTNIAQIQAHWHNLATLMVHNTDCIDAPTLAQHIARVRRDRLLRRRLSSTDALVRALQNVSIPLAAIYGEHDALYPDLLDSVQATLARAAGANWRGMARVAGAGHWVMHERPAAFAAALQQALQA